MPRLILACVLLFAQSFVLAHEFGHDQFDDSSVCDFCHSAQNMELGQAVDAKAPLPQSNSGPSLRLAGACIPPRTFLRANPARAPPC
jgi:hypothetical protein